MRCSGPRLLRQLDALSRAWASAQLCRRRPGDRPPSSTRSMPARSAPSSNSIRSTRGRRARARHPGARRVGVRGRGRGRRRRPSSGAGSDGSRDAPSCRRTRRTRADPAEPGSPGGSGLVSGAILAGRFYVLRDERRPKNCPEIRLGARRRRTPRAREVRGPAARRAVAGRGSVPSGRVAPRDPLPEQRPRTASTLSARLDRSSAARTRPRRPGRRRRPAGSHTAEVNAAAIAELDLDAYGWPAIAAVAVLAVIVAALVLLGWLQMSASSSRATRSPASPPAAPCQPARSTPAIDTVAVLAAGPARFRRRIVA